MCAVKAGPLAGPLQSSGGVLKSRWPPWAPVLRVSYSLSLNPTSEDMKPHIIWAPVPSSSYGLSGRKATLEEVVRYRALELCESRGGRKVTLKKK